MKKSQKIGYFLPLTFLRFIFRNAANVLTRSASLAGRRAIGRPGVRSSSGLASAGKRASGLPRPPYAGANSLSACVAFGLCFVAVGSAIYSYWCPKIIKRYASASEFAGGDGAHIGEYARGLIEIRIQKSPRRSEYIEFCDRMINRIDSEYSREQATEEMSNALLHFYFAEQNNKYLVARIAASIFFSVGFIILLLPSMWVFLKVANVLWALVNEHGLGALYS